MKLTTIYLLLGLLLSRAGAFVPRIHTNHPPLSTTLMISEFVTTVDISSAVSSPGMKEIVLLLTPLSALAGGALVQQRRNEVQENMEFTQLAMNETQAILSQSSNNFKVRSQKRFVFVGCNRCTHSLF